MAGRKTKTYDAKMRWEIFNAVRNDLRDTHTAALEVLQRATSIAADTDVNFLPKRGANAAILVPDGITPLQADFTKRALKFTRSALRYQLRVMDELKKAEVWLQTAKDNADEEMKGWRAMSSLGDNYEVREDADTAEASTSENITLQKLK